MSHFETPSWGEENETEKWATDLFAPSNVKLKKLKNRKRNKYPKGFLRSGISSKVKVTEDESASTSKSIKPEISDESSYGHKKTPSFKKKRKKGSDGDSKITEDDTCEPSAKLRKTVEKVKDISIHDNKNLISLKKKKNKISVEYSQVQGGVHETSAKVGKSIENSILENSQNSSPTKRKRKKKKNQGSNVAQDDLKEPPSKVRKSTENSIVKDSLNGSSTLESTSQLTPKKKKRRQKKNKANLNDIKTKENKRSEDLKTGQSSSVGITLKNGSLPGTVAQNIEESIKNGENPVNLKKSSRKKKKKQKSGGKSSLNPTKQSDPSNEFPMTLNEPVDISHKKQTLEGAEFVKKKKKKNVHESKVEDDENPQSLPQTNRKSSCDEKEEHSETKEELSSKSNYSFGTKKKNLSLREKMEEKLRGARFRFLNEQLYTSKSGDTNKYFLIEPKAFKAYHEGYKQQLNQWPVKPIDLIIKSLKKKPTSYVIADFGCGDALLAQSLPNKVHSFDHVALNEHVTLCDMANTPLNKGSMDVVVFCLSLMGSNLSDYIVEANRVLKIGGLMKIAEVESRFDDVNKFIKLIGKFGFLCTRQDSSNDYFYVFDFRKDKNIKEGKVLPSLELRACSYKKR